MLNSTKPTTAQVVGGVYSSVAPVPIDGQAAALQLDNEGNLLVNVAVGGGGGGSNASVGLTNTTAPTSATEVGIIDSGGKLQGVSATNPLPITGSISAANPSVGSTGITAPTSATEIGVIDGTGKLQGASSSNPVRIDPVGTTTQPVSGTVSIGNSPTVGLSAGTAVELLDSGGTNKASISAAGAVKVDGSAVTQPVSGTVTANAGTGTFAISGTVTANAGTNLNTSTLATDTHLTNPQVTGGGTSAPTTIVAVGGKTNDATPQYDILPEGPGGRSVIVEGVSGGVAVPVSGTFFQATQPVSGTVTVNAGTGTFTTSDSHFPAAGALSDALANPTTTEIGANLLGWDATNSVFRRVQVDAATGTLKVDGSGSTQPVSGTVTANAGTGDFATNLAQVSGTAVSTAASGVQKVGIVGNAGASVDTTINTGAAPTNALWTANAPATIAAASLTPIYVNSTAAKNLKSSAGNLYGVWIVNLTTTTTTTLNMTMYVHFFDTSNTTLATANWKFALPIASSGVVNGIGAGAGAGLNLPPGALALGNFVNGISIVINTTSTSNTTAAGTAPTGVIWIE